MNDYVSKAEVLDVYAELYDAFDDNSAILKYINEVYDKINELKAQEPRVISWQDAGTMRLCWVETKFPHTIRPSDLLQYFDESPCVTVFSIHQTPIDWPIDEYGIKWRCWDKEPTIEQMEAIPWN